MPLAVAVLPAWTFAGARGRDGSRWQDERGVLVAVRFTLYAGARMMEIAPAGHVMNFER
jgi:hypothetical protein